MARVWEEVGPRSRMVLNSTTLQDVCEIYTREEVFQGVHLNERWEGGLRWPDWGAFVGEGIATRRQKRRRDGGPPVPARLFAPKPSTPWSREGMASEPLFSIRKPGFRFNQRNLVYAGVPLCIFNDAFNAWGMSTKARDINR